MYITRGRYCTTVVKTSEHRVREYLLTSLKIVDLNCVIHRKTQLRETVSLNKLDPNNFQLINTQENFEILIVVKMVRPV
jgi:hypothetical protein